MFSGAEGSAKAWVAAAPGDTDAPRRLAQAQAEQAKTSGTKRP